MSAGALQPGEEDRNQGLDLGHSAKHVPMTHSQTHVKVKRMTTIDHLLPLRIWLMSFLQGLKMVHLASIKLAGVYISRVERPSKPPRQNLQNV